MGTAAGTGRRVSLAVAATLLLTGCDRSPGAVPVSPVGSTPPAHPSGLFASTSQTLGAVVIDGQGYLLYRSDRDDRAPSRSRCTGSCAQRWLPVPAASDLRVVGINRQLVGTLARPDGRLQLTLDGWPLYGYAGDRAPGDATGQEVDGVWRVVRPDGSAATGRPGPGG
ncbi:hypothetical protein KIF24_16180 [Micromonospora sp. Llam7]|uniref:COG4315 family predicted lipoprotein n=1 Tax=Micromonospora tarapacensis TaxID=2835305 RepID=UPI001C83FD3F|nr:hypothetical protein [Micromonospora tarapacensis]MBX7267414.1 hypothetical protein [Micromonospora tarapacensis]